MLLKTIDTYPIKEGVSGYWDVLSPEDLAEFDTAMDFVQVYVSASRDSRDNRDRKSRGVPMVGFGPVITDQFGKEAIMHAGIHMPDPWIFDSSIPRLKYIGRTPDNTTSMYMNPRGSIIYGPTKQ